MEEQKFLLSDMGEDCANAETGEKCPLLEEEICPGGWVGGYGGVPIEPPCCSMDADEDLTAWVYNYYSNLHRYEAREDARIKAEKEKQTKSELAKKRRQFVKMYCFRELSSVKNLKRRIKIYETSIENAEIYASAVNATNEMFRYSERYTINPGIRLRLDKLREELEEAEKALKDKKKEARGTQEYKKIAT